MTEIRCGDHDPGEYARKQIEKTLAMVPGMSEEGKALMEKSKREQEIEAAKAAAKSEQEDTILQMVLFAFKLNGKARGHLADAIHEALVENV